MNIIICGAGRVGFTIAKLLSEQGHSITVIDQSSEDIQKINDSLDVKAIVGKGYFPIYSRKSQCKRNRHDYCSYKKWWNQHVDLPNSIFNFQHSEKNC